MTTANMLHPHAYHAIRAAQHWHQWGRYAALTYCRKRGVPMSLLTLARVLEASTLFSGPFRDALPSTGEIETWPHN